MSYAFVGTPRFASWVLRELVRLGRAPVVVISQPDRPRGRGRAGKPPEAVCEAGLVGLPYIQTDDINSPELLERLRGLGVTTLAVAAFGQLLRAPLLDAFECVNIHASLLPKYRGAAPIERALMAGETKTGVSIMRITEGLDAGPWAQQVEVSVGLRQDAGSLSRLLAVAGACALAEVLDSIHDGTAVWTQQEGPASYAEKLSASDCELNVGLGAKQVHDHVRALCPAIGARAILGETEVKIWRTWPYGETGLSEVSAEVQAISGDPHRVKVVGERLFVGCGRGSVEILELQPLCKARMNTAAFLRGYRGRLGERMRPSSTNGRDSCGDS